MGSVLTDRLEENECCMQQKRCMITVFMKHTGVKTTAIDSFLMLQPEENCNESLQPEE